MNSDKIKHKIKIFQKIINIKINRYNIYQDKNDLKVLNHYVNKKNHLKRLLND